MTIRSALCSMDRSHPKFRWPWDESTTVTDESNPISEETDRWVQSQIALQQAERRFAELRERENCHD
jgi:hypothetical protein